jgi:pimeloyl-ACP methyl ester carboxylesterase
MLDSIHEPVTDSQAYLLLDTTTNQVYVVFRGTSSATDWWYNKGGFHAWLSKKFGGVGDPGYVKIKDRLAAWAETAKKHGGAIVVGHSLGGAMGQYFIGYHPEAVKEGVLFNSAGVDQHVADAFDKSGASVPVWYHLDPNDLVSNAGGATMIRGNVVFHEGKEGGLLDDHTEWSLAKGSSKDCERVPDELFDEFLKARTAAKTQEAGLATVIGYAGGYALESQAKPAIDALITVVNGGAAGVDKLVNGFESVVNGIGDAVEWIAPENFDFEDIDVPSIGRIPPFGGFHPDYSGIGKTGTPPGSGPGGSPGVGGGDPAPGKPGGKGPGGEERPTGGDGPRNDGDPSDGGAPTGRIQRPKPHIDRPPGWGVQ